MRQPQAPETDVWLRGWIILPRSQTFSPSDRWPDLALEHVPPVPQMCNTRSQNKAPESGEMHAGMIGADGKEG